VEWRWVRGAGEELSAITPPVRMEFVQFPNGIDLFNPGFSAASHAPAAAERFNKHPTVPAGGWFWFSVVQGCYHCEVDGEPDLKGSLDDTCI
jgi:hypothetical protein